MKMNKEKMKEVFDQIKASEKIIISRHIRPDGDAIGSSMGLCLILRESFPSKKIYLMNEDYSDTFSFLGNEDTPQTQSFYEDSLMIVTDTATQDRISNKNIGKAKRTIKIDHHFEVQTYGDISWVQSECSSTCEMIATFQEEFKSELHLTKQAAQCLYTGIITDNGNFKYKGTDGDTLRTAAKLADTGISLQFIHSHIDLQEPQTIKFQSYVLNHMKLTENGVAYVYISQKTQSRYNLNREQASDSVQYISNIKGIYIWVAFIENKDATIRARVRSREINIIDLSSRYGGGGHANACGATCHNKKEVKAFVSEADEIVKNYKLATK